MGSSYLRAGVDERKGKRSNSKISEWSQPRYDPVYERISSRSILNWILNDPKKLLLLLSSIPVSTDTISDEVSLKVWWIINEEEKYHLNLLLDYFKNIKEWLSNNLALNKELKKIYTIMWIILLRFIDSIWTQDEEELKKSWKRNKLYANMCIPWKALEYFIIDALNREKKDTKVVIEKWPIGNERQKVDFLVTQGGIKLWVQLTSQLIWPAHKIIYSKRNSLIRNQGFYNDKNKEIQLAKMSIKSIPDVPVLMIVNSRLSKNAFKKRILFTAFKRWWNDWFLNWWPSKYLDFESKKELKTIWESLPKLIKSAFWFIKEHYGEWNNTKSVNEWNTKFELNSDKLKVSYLDSEGNFMYSIEIFITYALLKKLWIKPYFNSWSQAWWDQTPRRNHREKTRTY